MAQKRQPRRPVTVDAATGVATPSHPRPKRYRAKLDTVADCARELKRLYRDARSSLIDVSDAGRLGYLLTQLRDALETVGQGAVEALTAEEKAARIAKLLIMTYRDDPAALARLRAMMPAELQSELQRKVTVVYQDESADIDGEEPAPLADAPATPPPEAGRAEEG